jgi:hypothetical protein
MNMWTQFMDMYSGGGSKENWEYIYIEASEDEAKVIFYNRFDHNPERVSCTCCGDDYSISESATLEESTAYERGCRWDKEKNRYVDEPDGESSWKSYRTLAEYKQDKSVLFISADEIKSDERTGDVPDEGYVWV